ncbi:MAG: cytochrome c oxidase, cbb3-type, subunit [Pseudomonadota bacterium]|jgi:cytochrome c oxidase cbb3-type subunit 3
MSDFVHDGWSLYIAIITLASLVACAVLLKMMSTRKMAPGEKPGTTGHVWDEDLQEWHNPLPSWWMWLFYITIVFAVVYLILYPGLGSYKGYLGWTSTGQYQDEQKEAAATFGPIIDKFLKQDVQTVAANPEAREIGQRLFLNYCAQCHGSDAGGSRGYPNLRDNDWLYGGTPDAIKATLVNGRNGAMPPMGAAVGGAEDVRDVAHFVLSLAGRTHDSLRAQRGKPKFASTCAACHGPDGKGNQQIGAPNLTDDIWLHGGTEAVIIETIVKGRMNQMPAHKDFLDEGKIHLLSAYVLGLSGQAAK